MVASLASLEASKELTAEVTRRQQRAFLLDVNTAFTALLSLSIAV